MFGYPGYIGETMRKVEIFEPWIFLIFGVFHLHRIWGLLDRKSYADFWTGVMDSKGWFYFLLMGALAVLCALGIRTFLKNLHDNYWWRWIYVLGGGYVLFDLFSIATGWELWRDLILKMYDTTAPWWNILWSAFIVMGGAVFVFGIKLLRDRCRQVRKQEDLVWPDRNW